MAVDNAQIIELIKTMHLFRKLVPAEIEHLAGLFQEIDIPKGETVFKQGDVSDSFYVVFQGKMRLVQQAGKQQRELTVLLRGDYFGEELLLRNERRTATVRAEEDLILLKLDKKEFAHLLRKIPGLRPNLETAVSSRHLSQHIHMSWLNPDEVVYLMLRKHPFFLWVRLIGPISLVLAAILLDDVLSGFGLGWLPGFVLGGSVTVAILWGAWNAWDWSNDYYIVTNQRVVWSEKIVGIYDSRDELPLTSLLSVSVNSDQTGRIFHFGDVVLRTYTNVLVFRHTNHPEQIAPIIEEHWYRARVSSHQVEAVAMERAIRQRLGMAPMQPTPEDQAILQQKKPAAPRSKPGLLSRLFSNFYHVRFEEGDIVTYRKHWFVLVQNTWVQSLLLLAGGVVMILRLFGKLAVFSLTTTAILVVIYLAFVGLWYFYDYVDWRNDIYQVTPDQVLDIYRKPLGREEKRSAPLENILSIDYDRADFFHLLLNFGTVKIKVGTDTLIFNDVYDPSQVQKDIFNRMLEQKARKRAMEAQAERERVSEWIATYHRLNNLGEPGNSPESPENSG